MTIDTNGRRGQVVIELADWIAPKTAAQMRTLARARFYDGLDFYRVIENFVAQGGQFDADKPMPEGTADLAAELMIATENLPEVFEAVQVDDFYASETAFMRGFAVGRDDENGPVWLLHCPGVMAMARSDDINSASTEFYFPIGQSPRHLDRNLTIVGRVIDGFEHIQGVKRDTPDGDGIIDEASDRSLILTVRVAADLKNFPVYEVEDTRSDAFLNGVDRRRVRTGPFWHNAPPQIIDACTVTPQVRVTLSDGS